jgi:hypothetical protein
MEFTKEKVYNELLNVHRQTGQGLAGIVRVMGHQAPEINKFLAELIDEGKVKCCETGGSIGHPESNRFYMPMIGYNVWEDEGTDGKISHHKGRYLHHVRKYLNINESKGIFDVNAYFETEEGQKDYNEWLERNKEQLELMLNIPNY